MKQAIMLCLIFFSAAKISSAQNEFPLRNISWSNDGNSILFDSLTNGKYSIYSVAIAPPNKVTALTPNLIGNNMDGDFFNASNDFVFVSDRNAHDDIFLSKKGSPPIQLSKALENQNNPSVSQDGKMVAYVKETDDDSKIFKLWVMNIDGSQSKMVPVSVYSVSSPKWIGAGNNKIICSVKETKDSKADLCVVDVPEGIFKIIARDPGIDIQPSYSSKNEKIIFAKSSLAQQDIFVTNMEGTVTTKLTSNPGKDLYPSWSPDGSKIAYIAWKNGSWGIFVMNFNDGEKSAHKLKIK